MNKIHKLEDNIAKAIDLLEHEKPRDYKKPSQLERCCHEEVVGGISYQCRRFVDHSYTTLYCYFHDKRRVKPAVGVITNETVTVEVRKITKEEAERFQHNLNIPTSVPIYVYTSLGVHRTFRHNSVSKIKKSNYLYKRRW